jgi:hypothetical protein
MFNGSYSSQFNPIEVLWAFAKREFRREMITITDYKDKRNKLHKLVERCIRNVPPEFLKKYTDKVMYSIEAELK